MSNKETIKPTFAGQAIVIPGEAPETDDEGEADHSRNSASSLGKITSNLPTSYQQRANFTQHVKRDSLLHNKLRDAQINLTVDSADFTGKTTRQMNAEVQRVAQSVCASQVTLQDATFHIRTVAEDLYKIDDNLDAIFSSHATIPDLTNFDDFPTVKRYSKVVKW